MNVIKEDGYSYESPDEVNSLDIGSDEEEATISALSAFQYDEDESTPSTLTEPRRRSAS